MNQVSEVSRQYAAGSKQSAEAAQQLSSLATALRSSIAQFSTEFSTGGEGQALT